MRGEKTKRFLTIFVGVLFLLTMAPLAGYAEVPQLINYQGKLTDADGSPVADGDYLMVFAIYDVPSGGTALWSELQIVAVTNGIYNVVLGQPPRNPLDPDDFDGNRYLGVTVGTDDAEMTPRQKLTSTPFAMKAAKADDADTVDGLDSGDFAEATHTHDGSDITTGTVADDRIAVSIARDNEIMPTVLGNDGPGSGLNADFFDGYNENSFFQLSQNETVSGIPAFNGGDSRSTPPFYVDSSIVVQHLNADRLDGLDAGAFLTTLSDYGRSGVATNLYEGTTSLASKYVNESGDTMSGSSTGAVLSVTNSGNGYGLYGYASGSSGSGVYGQASGSSGHGVHGYASGGSGYGGFFTCSNDHLDLALGGAVGRINTDPTNENSDLILSSNNDVMIRLDNDGGENGVFRIKNSGSGDVCTVDENGKVACKVLQITGGSDLSEQFDVRAIKEDLLPSPGMVVSIDPKNPGDLIVSNNAYDRRVAGIISGAGGIKPGMLMGQKGSEANGANPVALTGRVYCWADTSKSPIEPGDLLTTSNNPGHAMKVTDYAKAQGAILGKAMSPLESGRGLVLVLVTLQ